MTAKNDNRRRTQSFRSEVKNVYRSLNRGLNRRQAAVAKGIPRDFMQSRGGGGWKVSRVMQCGDDIHVDFSIYG